jgi:hypothetical protein
VERATNRKDLGITASPISGRELRLLAAAEIQAGSRKHKLDDFLRLSGGVWTSTAVFSVVEPLHISNT